MLMLLVFYGKGKGKTSAAIGTALRALGRGWRVVVVQFMKSWDSGERTLMKKLSGKGMPLEGRLIWMNFGTKEFVNPNDLSNYAASVNMAFSYGFILFELPKILSTFKPKLLVLDELGVAVHLGIIDEYTVIDFLQEFRGSMDKHAIVTGRYVSSVIRSEADLITRLDEVKHYFRSLKRAVEGLDL
jgi:cob(I)alamin adenosyltransferase